MEPLNKIKKPKERKRKMYIVFYEGFDALVSSYEEGYRLVAERFGFYDAAEVFFEEA